MKKNNYAVFDTETTPIKEGEQKFIIGGLYDGNILSYHRDELDLCQNMLMLNCKYLYAHNLNYDFRFIITPFINLGFSFEVITSNSSIIEVKIKNKDKTVLRLRDTFCIFRTSLRNMGKDLCKTQKLELDYENIESLDEGSIKEYLKNDLLVLYESVKTFQRFLGRDNLNMTISSIAMGEFNRTNTKKIQQPVVYEHIFRESYYGGRVEVFNPICRENANYYDVNSLYPYCMKTKILPYGKMVKVKENEVNDYPCFIAECEIKIPEREYITPIPYRLNNKLIFPCGKLKGFYCSPEINKAIDLGYEVKIIRAWSFTDFDFLFYDYVNKFYGLRLKAKEEKNKSVDMLCKLLLNSLYGKFAMDEKDEKLHFIEQQDFYDFVKKCETKNREVEVLSRHNNQVICLTIEKVKKKKFSTTYISSFITSYARIHLYDYLKQCIDENEKIFYCDTDSIITTKEFNTSKNLGDLKLEHQIIEGYFPLPKFYGFIEYDSKEKTLKKKIKAKGFLSDNFKYNDLQKFIFDDLVLYEDRLICSTIKKIAHGWVKEKEVINQGKKMQYSSIEKKRVFDKDFNSKPIYI